MATDRSAVRTTAAVERRPVVAATIQRSAAPAMSPARAIQQRIGHQAAQALVARSVAAPNAEAASQGLVPVSVLAPHSVQLAAKVSSPHDLAELEAEETARKVARMSHPAESATKTGRAELGTVHREAASAAPIPAAAQVNIAGGAPLPPAVRSFMEPRFGASFGNVRVHTGESAAQQSADLNAHAFTVGEHVFFGRDKFQPESASGRELIAHELTHTIQQGGAVQRDEDTTVTQRAQTGVQRASGPRNYFAEKANLIPGYRLLTIVIGVNPINMESVAPSAANILRALLELIPVAGALIAQALDNYGIFARVGAWVEGQIRSLGMVGNTFKRAIDEFVDSLGLSDLNPFGFGALWERAKRIFTEPVDRLIAFGKSLASDIIRFIREAILLPLAKLAEGTRGYDLLKAVLGEDPVTGQPVARTPEALIGGFMKFIGQEEIWENVKKANAIPRAWKWFQEALAGLLGFVRQIPTMFVNTLKSLDLSDLILVPKAFVKLATVFGGFALQFVTWAGNAMWTLLELIFEVVSPATLTYLKKTGAALKGILKNPLPFVHNLVNAAKLGFQNFADNFGSHLKAGLIDWLTGSLEGVYIPKALSLPELGKFAISVLGISWAQIRGKIVKVLGPSGETIMKGLETGFDIVVALVTGGPAAAWELIKEKLNDLKDQVVSGIVGFVTDTVVKKAIPKLISMFIPGAGFISAIVSIYDTIMVFVEKISKIIQVVTAFIDSIVAIAGGNITAAAKRVENILGNLLSLAISFLAGFLGLGKVTDKIKEIIEKVRISVDKAIDAAIAWIVDKAKKLFAKLFGKDKPDERTEAQKTLDVEKAIAAAEVAMAKEGADQNSIRKELQDIKKTYRLVTIELVKVSGDEMQEVDQVVAEINPKRKSKEKVVKKVTVKDKNYEVEWGLNKAGETITAKATLKEVFSGEERSSAEVTAQGKAAAKGAKDDVGGHIIGHRFVKEHGIINMFPQNVKFNNSAWKKMENEWAAAIREGHHVKISIKFSGGTTTRPAKVTVKYQFIDVGPPEKETYANDVVFKNDDAQTFDRLSKEEIAAL
jgi:uncharacterized protein DUF4157/DNA/RNA non-specific endonuclease